MTAVRVIYNPVAGRGRLREQWPAVEAALRQAGVDFEAVATSAPREAVTLARQAAEAGRAVVAVGGDGTVHECVNGLLQASGEGETTPLGVIPMGSGDDFAKVIPPQAPVGGRPFDMHVAVEKIVRGQTRLLDVGRLRGDHARFEAEGSPHYFMNGMDVGFGAHAVVNFATIPKALTGMAAYMAAVLKTLVDYPKLQVRLQLDDQPPFAQGTVMTAITNGRCFGNGFWVCPDAAADDGLLDLMVAGPVGRLTILGIIPKIMKGEHMGHPAVKMLRARRVVLESEAPLIVEADGEIPYTETHRLEVDLLPNKLRLFV